MKTPNIEKKTIGAIIGVLVVGIALLIAILFTGKSDNKEESKEAETSESADAKGGSGPARQKRSTRWQVICSGSHVG